MKNSRRLCLYPKDVQLITGKSYKHARRYLTKIRQHYQKTPNQMITVLEFSCYSGVSVDEIWSVID